MGLPEGFIKPYKLTQVEDIRHLINSFRQRDLLSFRRWIDQLRTIGRIWLKSIRKHLFKGKRTTHQAMIHSVLTPLEKGFIHYWDLRVLFVQQHWTRSQLARRTIDC